MSAARATVRIAHVCRVAPPSVGGMERAVATLAAWQQAAGEDVVVVTGTPGPPTVAGVPARRLRALGAGPLLRLAGLRGALADRDVVVVHGLDGLLGAALWAARGRPVVAVTHGGVWHTRRAAALKRVWLRGPAAAALRAMAAVWASSAADAAQLAAVGVPATVMPNPVAPPALAAVEGPDSARRAEGGSWLVPGRLDAHKGHQRLLEVLAAWPGSRAGWLEVVGPEASPGRADALRRVAARLGVRALVRGPLEDAALAARIAAAARVVLPSEAEGFGLLAVEAMALGQPPVVRAIPAYEELVVDGVNGHVVALDAPDSPARLAAALQADVAPLRAAARATAARYAPEVVVPRWTAALAALVGR